MKEIVRANRAFDLILNLNQLGHKFADMGDITMDIGKKVTGAFQRRTKTKKENNVGEYVINKRVLVSRLP